MGTSGVGALARRVSVSEEDATAVAPTVLVVDDDGDTRASITELLEEAGYRVIGMTDGQNAFDFLADNPAPACIILDLWMPVMDGWTLASEIQRGRLPPAPIVVVTAAGAHYGYPVPPGLVLRKPISPSRLIRIVESVAPLPKARDS